MAQGKQTQAKSCWTPEKTPHCYHVRYKTIFLTPRIDHWDSLGNTSFGWPNSKASLLNTFWLRSHHILNYILFLLNISCASVVFFIISTSPSCSTSFSQIHDLWAYNKYCFTHKHTQTQLLHLVAFVCTMYLRMSTWAWITYQDFILKKSDSPSSHWMTVITFELGNSGFFIQLKHFLMFFYTNTG